MRTERMRRAFLLLVCGGALAYLPSAAIAAGTQVVHLGDAQLDVPKRYLTGSTPWWLRFLSGLDNSEDVELEIDASEVASSVTGYQPFENRMKNNLLIHLVALNDEDRARYFDHERFSDIWRGAGSYRDRIVERDKAGTFRVYRKIEYPNSWEVFKVDPDSSSLPTDVYASWYGHCLLLHTPVVTSEQSVLCTSNIVMGNLAAEFHISGKNLAEIHGVREFITKLVAQWRR